MVLFCPELKVQVHEAAGELVGDVFVSTAPPWSARVMLR